jgi:hypothetical protein
MGRTENTVPMLLFNSCLVNHTENTILLLVHWCMLEIFCISAGIIWSHYLATGLCATIQIVNQMKLENGTMQIKVNKLKMAYAFYRILRPNISLCGTH